MFLRLRYHPSWSNGNAHASLCLSKPSKLKTCRLPRTTRMQHRPTENVLVHTQCATLAELLHDFIEYARSLGRSSLCPRPPRFRSGESLPFLVHNSLQHLAPSVCRIWDLARTRKLSHSVDCNPAKLRTSSSLASSDIFGGISIRDCSETCK